MGHEWRPIEPLPDPAPAWDDSEFAAIVAVLADLKRDAPELAAEALSRSARDAAIETGMVEGLYRWDRSVTEKLITEGIRLDLLPLGAGINRSDADVAGLLEDQRAVMEGLFAAVRSERQISQSYIRELHAQLVRHQPTYVAQTAGRASGSTARRWRV